MTERSDTPESPSKEQESLRDKILAERDKGNLVYAHLEGYSVVKVEDFVKQPAEGMLYDLNRGEEVSLSFITEKKWVNDFAVALTIRKLVEQRDAARSERLPLDQIEETAINMACPVGFVTYLRALKENAAPQAQQITASPGLGGCPTPAESAPPFVATGEFGPIGETTPAIVQEWTPPAQRCVGVPMGLFWQTADGKWHLAPGSTDPWDIHDNGRPIHIALLGKQVRRGERSGK